MNAPIPFFSLKRQWESIQHIITPAVQEVLASNQFIGGPYVEQFEQTFASYCGTKHAIACNSGTDALWIALLTLNIKPNDIVLTTPFSFIASSSEIAAHGAIPVFIDIDESYNMSPEKLEQWLTSNAIIKDGKTIHATSGRNVAGIVTVDIFGQCADYHAIKKIADTWNLWIIEDACQAVGANINNQKTGNLGDITCFSLYPTKNLGAYGDGGVMTTNDPEIAKTLLKLRNHGRQSHYNYECLGRNSRLDSIQAVITTKKLSFLDQWNNRRREIAQIYTKRLSKIAGISTPCEKIGHHVYHQYCICVTDAAGNSQRDALQKYLTDNGIGTNIFYPKALQEVPFLTPPADLTTNCVNTVKTVQSILALPIWPELTNEEVNHICTIIEQAPMFTNVQQPRKSHCCCCNH